MRSANWQQSWRQSLPRLILIGLALVPFPVWRQMQFVLWAQSPLTDAARDNVSWPFAGFVDAIAGTMSGASFGGGHLALRAYVLAAMALLAIFCGMVTLRLNGAFRTPRMRAAGGRMATAVRADDAVNGPVGANRISAGIQRVLCRWLPDCRISPAPAMDRPGADCMLRLGRRGLLGHTRRKLRVLARVQLQCAALAAYFRIRQAYKPPGDS